jgi:alpha-aminoadipate carrier protein LysW
MMPRCPECDAAITVGHDAVKGEVVSCPDCGAELEVRETSPVALALAPEAQEDWGE